MHRETDYWLDTEELCQNWKNISLHLAQNRFHLCNNAIHCVMFRLIRTTLAFKYNLYLFAFTASATSSAVVCAEPQTHVISHCRPDWLQWRKIAVVITWQTGHLHFDAVQCSRPVSVVMVWCSFFFCLSPVRLLLIVLQCYSPFLRQLSLSLFVLLSYFVYLLISGAMFWTLLRLA